MRSLPFDIRPTEKPPTMPAWCSTYAVQERVVDYLMNVLDRYAQPTYTALGRLTRTNTSSARSYALCYAQLRLDVLDRALGTIGVAGELESRWCAPVTWVGGECQQFLTDLLDRAVGLAGGLSPLHSALLTDAYDHGDDRGTVVLPEAQRIGTGAPSLATLSRLARGETTWSLSHTYRLLRYTGLHGVLEPTGDIDAPLRIPEGGTTGRHWAVVEKRAGGLL